MEGDGRDIPQEDRFSYLFSEKNSTQSVYWVDRNISFARL